MAHAGWPRLLRVLTVQLTGQLGFDGELTLPVSGEVGGRRGWTATFRRSSGDGERRTGFGSQRREQAFGRRGPGLPDATVERRRSCPDDGEVHVVVAVGVLLR